MAILTYKNSTSSTNDEIINLISGNKNLLAVYTFNQTSGRGQYGNAWNIIAHQNLAYTIAVATKNINLSDIFFNYHTAIIIKDFLANMTQEEVKIKWPNDIIINQKKVCGVLIERKKIKDQLYFIIGIGINLLQTDFENLPKAGSILTTTGKEFDLKAFAEAFHDYLSEQIILNPKPQNVLSAYNKNLFRKDEVSVFQKDDIRQNGIIKQADEDGFLWVELEKDGLQKFYHKQIELLY